MSLVGRIQDLAVAIRDKFNAISPRLLPTNAASGQLPRWNGAQWVVASPADFSVQPEQLAPVATSGAYTDLSGKPTLGTAAATASTAYATAAQGAKADTAVQSSTVTSIVSLTQAQYDALAVKDPATLYVIA
jgi:hypothetical protein